jgi:hypothetical protein
MASKTAAADATPAWVDIELSSDMVLVSAEREQEDPMSAHDVDVPKVKAIRFRSGPGALTQRDLVAASLLLRPDGKDLGVRGDHGGP